MINKAREREPINRKQFQKAVVAMLYGGGGLGIGVRDLGAGVSSIEVLLV